MKIFRFLLLMIFCLQVFAEEPYEIRKKNHTLNVGMTRVSDNLDPVLVENVQTDIMIQDLYRPLSRVNDRGFFEAGLAKGWQIDPDGKTYTFHLYPDAKFSDGSPVLASDVAWSISRNFWPNSRSFFESHLSGDLEGADSVKTGERVSGIEVLDDHTLRFRFKQFHQSIFYFLSASEFGVLPENRFDGRSPIASFPIQAKYDSEKKSWLLSRFPEESGVSSQLKSIRILPVSPPTPKKAERLVKSGEVDLLMGFLASEIKQIELPDNFELRTVDIPSYTHLFYNMERPIFANRDFRRDLSELIQTAIQHFKDPNGITKLMHTYLWSGVMPKEYYERPFTLMSPDVFKSKWPNPLTLELLLKDDFLDQPTAQALTKTLGSAGITLHWSYLAPLSYIQALKDRSYDLILGAYMGPIWDPEVAMPPLKKENPTRYFNGDETDLFERVKSARLIPDRIPRLKSYQSAFEHFENQHYFVPVSEENFVVIVRKGLVLRKEHPFNYEGLSLWSVSWG